MAERLCGGCEVAWMQEEGIPLPPSALDESRLCDPCVLIEGDDLREGDGISLGPDGELPEQSFRIVSEREDIDQVPDDLNSVERKVYVSEQGGGVIYYSRNFDQSR